MKNTIRCIAITVLTVVIGFSFVACLESDSPPANETPVAADYDIGNLTQTAGSVTAVTVTAKAGKSPGAVTVLYNGSAAIPQTAGSYAVTFNVAAADGWNEANGLSAGTLTVNSASSANQTPISGDYTISNLTQTEGSVTAVTVTAKAGKSPGAVTVQYNGSAVIPQTIGSYAVTFDVAAAAGWNAASGLYAGLLIVNPAGSTNQTPTASDYTIGNLTQTAGYVTAVTITPQAGKSPGTITVLYNNSTTLPQTVGSYAVTFNVEAAAGWNAASGLSAGLLTVNNKATPTIITWPTAAAITYGAALSKSMLTGGVASVPGTFAWTNGSIIPTVTNSGYQVTFTPIDTANYNTITIIVDITVIKAAGAAVTIPTVSSTPTQTSITLTAITTTSTGQTVEYARNSSNSAPTTGWQDSASFTGLSAGTIYYFFARAKANDNYNAGPASTGTAVSTAAVTGTINVTFTGLTEKIISINRTITDNLSKIGGGSITLEVTEDFAQYEWFIGETKAATGKEVTLQANNAAFAIGYNWITVVVYEGTDSGQTPYSGVFTVQVIE